MAASSLTIRLDSDLKDGAASVVEHYGLDLPAVEVGCSVGELVYGAGIVNAVVSTRKLAVEFLGSLARCYAVEANVFDVLCAIKPSVEDVALFSATLAGALELFEYIKLVGIRVVLELGLIHLIIFSSPYPVCQDRVRRMPAPRPEPRPPSWVRCQPV